MSATVDYTYYTDVYLGTEADAASFPALSARAEDIVGAMARWTDPAEMSAFQLTLYKKAICSQTDFLAVNGLDSVTGSRSDNGFTVGKVHVNGRAGSEQKSSGGAMAGNISPMAALYLEQSGLMNPAVPVVGGCVC